MCASVKPWSRSMVKKASGWAIAATATTGLPRRLLNSTWLASARLATVAKARRAVKPEPNAGCWPVCSTSDSIGGHSSPPARLAVVGLAMGCLGQGSRSGPAGSRKPLPKPRSSNTQISRSRCNAWCCRPSSHTITWVSGYWASKALAASTRKRATKTAAPVDALMRAGSSPTSAAGLSVRTSRQSELLRP